MQSYKLCMRNIINRVRDFGIDVINSETRARSNVEIQEFAKGKGATFPVLGKLEVNGPNESPLYTYLKSKQGGFMGSAIKWNFGKFLCRNGVPVKRYAPTDSPLSFEQDIVAELNKGLVEN